MHACHTPSTWSEDGRRWSCRRCGAVWILHTSFDRLLGEVDRAWDRDAAVAPHEVKPFRFAPWLFAAMVLVALAKVVVPGPAIDGLTLTGFLLFLAWIGVWVHETAGDQ